MALYREPGMLESLNYALRNAKMTFLRAILNIPYRASLWLTIVSRNEALKDTKIVNHNEALRDTKSHNYALRYILQSYKKP